MPQRAASCLTLILCCTHKASTFIMVSIVTDSCQLGTVAVDVLDDRLVAPGNLLVRQAKHRRDAIALLRTGRPSPR